MELQENLEIAVVVRLLFVVIKEGIRDSDGSRHGYVTEGALELNLVFSSPSFSETPYRRPQEREL